MLSEKELRALICIRFSIACKSCNSGHRVAVDAQIRGLVCALTGKPSPVIWGYGGVREECVRQMLDQAAIPYTVEGQYGVSVDENWLREHGFDENGKHPLSEMDW